MNTEYEDLLADQTFTSAEVQSLAVLSDGQTIVDYLTPFDPQKSRTVRKILLVRVLWLNPPSLRSSRVGGDFNEYDGTTRQPFVRNYAVGWRCEECKAVIFALDHEALKHAPCCGEEP